MSITSQRSNLVRKVICSSVQSCVLLVQKILRQHNDSAARGLFGAVTKYLTIFTIERKSLRFRIFSCAITIVIISYDINAWTTRAEMKRKVHIHYATVHHMNHSLHVQQMYNPILNKDKWVVICLLAYILSMYTTIRSDFSTCFPCFCILK